MKAQRLNGSAVHAGHMKMCARCVDVVFDFTGLPGDWMRYECARRQVKIDWITNVTDLLSIFDGKQGSMRTLLWKSIKFPKATHFFRSAIHIFFSRWFCVPIDYGCHCSQHMIRAGYLLGQVLTEKSTIPFLFIFRLNLTRSSVEMHTFQNGTGI